jgi:hypothetical protein
MDNEILWLLVLFLVLNFTLVQAGSLAIKWKFRKSKKPWKTDEEILNHEKAIKEHLAVQGKDYDLMQGLAKAIVRRDWNKLEKIRETTDHWGSFVHAVGQTVLIVFIANAYSNENLKLLVVTAIFFVWRSVNYRSERQEQFQTVILSRLHMAQPTAEEDFFKTEHLYDPGMHTRVWELVNKAAKKGEP